MRILITGATGLIGQEIVKLCHKEQILVNYLTTSKSKITSAKEYQGFYWNPKENEIDTACFKDVEVIIHLAGASIAKRWTSSYKNEILSSRIIPTQLLIETIKKGNYPIKQVVSASAIGIYPDCRTHYYDETFNESYDSFLYQVVQQWEQAVDGFSTLGIIVSKLRTGLVLSEKGGALPQIVNPIKLGLGAAFGTGKQWQSWIHIEDLAHIYLYVLKQRLEGVYNAVAPNAVTNKELTKTAAQVLERPLFLPNIPKGLMKLILGDMHTLLFASQRVSSKKIEDEGFDFEFHHLKPALVDVLKR
ncbi:TIGR01777 family oxidoreductase [Mariniflexile ostreae]|uniref:TIGR01777 family oxidoreductase n=1 Tax=Mariniflexile ostreae TaxID=1520892 RepID=A0ABV5FE51_9FLAO